MKKIILCMVIVFAALFSMPAGAQVPPGGGDDPGGNCWVCGVSGTTTGCCNSGQPQGRAACFANASCVWYTIYGTCLGWICSTCSTWGYCKPLPTT